MKLKKNLESISQKEKDGKYTISEIKYFSTDGRKNIPNGHVFQKGGFIKECKDNSNKFKTENYQYFINDSLEIVEAVHSTQYGLSDYRGGIVIFSTDVNSLDISKNRISNWVKKKLKSLKNRFISKSKLNQDDKKVGEVDVEDYIGAFSIGNFFSGRYIGDNNKVFDKNSLSLEINGISSEGLIYLAEEIAMEFEQVTVLVKDLNQNKIFLVDQDRGGSYDVSNLNKRSIGT